MPAQQTRTRMTRAPGQKHGVGGQSKGSRRESSLSFMAIARRFQSTVSPPSSGELLASFDLEFTPCPVCVATRF